MIPRPETADVFARLAQLLLDRQQIHEPQRPLNVVDLCTGSGPIPILLKHLLGRHVTVSGYDYSEPAIDLARENIALNKCDVQVHRADIMRDDFPSTVKSDVAGKVDLIVSNPPYITAEEYRSIPVSVRDWEDPAALLGSVTTDSTGLEFYERIAELLPPLSTGANLEEAGWTGIPRVAVEIGHKQGSQVQEIFKGCDLQTEVWKDQHGRDRMVLGWSQSFRDSVIP